MFREYFILLLLGHVLGDFYIQTEKMAERKEKSIKWLLLHCLLYWGVLLLIGLPLLSFRIVLGATLAAGFHCLIDIIKHIYMLYKKPGASILPAFHRNVFILDQLSHAFCLIGIAYWFATNHVALYEAEFIKDFFRTIGVSEIFILKWLLALLLIHKPANIAISKLLLIYKPEDNNEDKMQDRNAGRLIGTVERIIMLIFLSIGQYSAIGLVLTAKSIARYDKISKEKNFAEYYLLGTLTSTVMVIVVSFVL